MSVKSFGSLLITLGFFLMVSVYMIFQMSGLDLMQNLQYTVLIEISPSHTEPDPSWKPDPSCNNRQADGLIDYACVVNQAIVHDITIPSKNIRLGQGLLFPLGIICIGFLFNREVFPAKSVVKILPFLNKQ